MLLKKWMYTRIAAPAGLAVTLLASAAFISIPAAAQTPPPGAQQMNQAQLPAGAQSALQQALANAIAAAKGDPAAVSAAISNAVTQAIAQYGAQYASSITMSVMMTASQAKVSSSVLGMGLAQASVRLEESCQGPAKEQFCQGNVAEQVAQTVANFGNTETQTAYRSAVSNAGYSQLASIAAGATAAIPGGVAGGTPGGGFGGGTGGGGGICLNDSCTR